MNDSRTETREHAPSPSGQQWTIRHGDYEATVVEVGGGLRSLTYQGRDIVYGYPADQMADAGRGQVLMPWPNRIEDGTYSFGGHDYLLALSEPKKHNATHGLVRWATWNVRAGADGDSHVSLETTLHPQPGWAWTLHLTMTYTLTGDGLAITASATNLSDTPCPFGFGMHPYLTTGETTLDDVVVTAPVRQQLVTNERSIPTGKEDAPGQLAKGLPLRGVGLDTCFTDVVAGDDGRWVVRMTSGQHATQLWADASTFGYVQLFTADGLPEPKNRRSGLAVEPMTCPANAFNSGEGLISLGAGETWSGTFGISAGQVEFDPLSAQPRTTVATAPSGCAR